MLMLCGPKTSANTTGAIFIKHYFTKNLYFRPQYMNEEVLRKMFKINDEFGLNSYIFGQSVGVYFHTPGCGYLLGV